MAIPLTGSEYKKKIRRQLDSPTSGHIICPGSFLPIRPGISLMARFIHTVELSKRKHVHGSCDECGIHFSLTQSIWNQLWIPPGFSGGEFEIPGLSMSGVEAKILLPILQEAFFQAQQEWEEKLWQIIRTRGKEKPSSLISPNLARSRGTKANLGFNRKSQSGQVGHPNGNGETL